MKKRTAARHGSHSGDETIENNSYGLRIGVAKDDIFSEKTINVAHSIHNLFLSSEIEFCLELCTIDASEYARVASD
jgi:hypothetical protein